MTRENKQLSLRPGERRGTPAQIEDESQGVQQEQRRDQRFPTSMQVLVRRLEPKSWHRGICVNISNGGLALQTAEVLNVGEFVQLELLGPDGATSVCGRVVYRSMHRYGIVLIGDGEVEKGRRME